MPLPSPTPLQIHSIVEVKDKNGKANLIQGLDRPFGLPEVEAGRIYRQPAMKVARLPALLIGGLPPPYPPQGDALVLISVSG